MSRQNLLETAFSEFPSKIGSIGLRRLSAGSFTLLGRLDNPMIAGKGKPSDAASAGVTQMEMFDAVVVYAWVHSAPLESVAAVETNDDLPAKEIRALAFEISISDAFEFLASYERCALRMAANLAEVDSEDDDGKLGKPQGNLPAGLHRSFIPAGPVEIPFVSSTSFGSCPSSEPSPISMLPTLPAEHDAVGEYLTSETFMIPEAPTTPQS